MEKKLTIVVPAYNMEKYLRKCLDSLILDNQRIMNNMEVLIINDGSTDKTLEIAREFEIKIPNVFRVIDKENGGKGSCMNLGIQMATGKYIKELDADDYFDGKAFESFLQYIYITDVDMVLTDFCIVNSQGRPKEHSRYSFPTNEVLKVDDFCDDLEFLKIKMHSVTYKVSELRKNQFSQSEGVPYTDMEWVFLPIIYMNSFSYLPISLYNYLIGRAGQSVDISILSQKAGIRIGLLMNRINIYTILAKQNSIVNKKLNYLRNRVLNSTFRIYRCGIVIKQFDDSLLESFDQTLKDANLDLYKYMEVHGDPRLFGLSYIKPWRKKRKKSIIVLLINIAYHFKLKFY